MDQSNEFCPIHFLDEKDQANEFCPFHFIDEKGILDVDRLEDFVKEVKLAECGLSYSTVSIMGPQSSGKSTLLNHLFGTNFKEMDALKERCQTTKGIWLAKCSDIEPCTLVLDLEGTDGTERGEDDTAFEKQAALFALAVSDVVLINMWCHDVGRVQAANKPLLRMVFQVMRQLFHDRKTTLLFVLRDKIRTPMGILEDTLQKDLQQIWDSFAKSDAEKETPLSEIFNVKIVALSSYEEKVEQFKEQVDHLKQQILNSVAHGGIVEAGRNIVPASGFSFSAQQIWKIIKENKDLNLPAHKVMVASVRCEEIAKNKLASFTANEDWRQLDKNVKSHPVPGFRKKISVVLETCLSEYDVETAYFDEGVRTEKRGQLKDTLLQLSHLAYQSLLEHISSQTLDKFKEAFQRRLTEGEEFSMAACNSTKYFMTQFDEECAEAIIEQANWDSSKVRHKLQRDIDAHVAAVRSSMLSELLNRYKAQLEEVLSVPVATLLVGAGDDTWHQIRELFRREIQSPVKEFSTALCGFSVDEETKHKMLGKLEEYARGVIQTKSGQEAGRVLTHMKDRFTRVFSYDSNSKLRIWSEYEDCQAIGEAARYASLRLLSNMAAIRLDDGADDIEKILFLALEAENVSPELCDPLTSDTWEQVPSSRTLIKPSQCKDFWREFNEYSKPIVVQAKEACRTADPKWSFQAGLAAGAALGLGGAAAIGAAGGPAAKALGSFAAQFIAELGPVWISALKGFSTKH